MEWVIFGTYIWASLAILIVIDSPSHWWKAPMVLLWPLLIPLWLIEYAGYPWNKGIDRLVGTHDD